MEWGVAGNGSQLFKIQIIRQVTVDIFQDPVNEYHIFVLQVMHTESRIDGSCDPVQRINIIIISEVNKISGLPVFNYREEGAELRCEVSQPKECFFI
jgi:hypothetical protein